MKKQALATVANKAVIEAFPYLVRFVEKNGYAPTIRELAKKFGYKSPQSGTWLYTEMEKAGYIKIMRTKAGYAKSRAVQIIYNKLT